MKNRYFESKKLQEGIYQITNSILETGNPAYSYLVIGEKAAMLVESMFGIGSLKAYCETLTDKPILHVCTHAHNDHTGGCGEFADVWMSPRDFESFYHNQKTHREYTLRAVKDSFKPEYRESFNEKDIIPAGEVRLHPLFEGDRIDLGDKMIEVIDVPGHTAGEIVLLDRSARCLYGGDACNCFTLLHRDDFVSVRDYRDRLIHLSSFLREFDVLYNGHDIRPAEIIEQGIELCSKILAREDFACPLEGIGGANGLIAAPISAETYLREDGKLFNAVYCEETIETPRKMENVITVH